VVAGYSGGKKKLYEVAWKSLLSCAIQARDAVVKCFVKLERWNPLSGDKDPRIIMFRSKRFTLAMLRYVKAIEEHVYRFKWNGTSIFSKGKTNEEISQLVEAKFKRHGCCISVDCSRFDAHVRAQALLITHVAYMTWITSLEFAELLAMTIKNRVRGAGMAYEVHGGRCSGDADTALGNCWLMLLMLVTALSKILLWSAFDLLINGDDALVFISPEFVDMVIPLLVSQFQAFGHEIEIDAVYYRFEDIEFCHTKPINLGRGCTMIRDPRRVMSHAVCGSKYFGSHKSIKNLCFTIGSCELSLNSGVPVLQEFAKMLMRLGEGGKMLDDGHISQLYHATQDSPGALRKETPITGNARLDMAISWDIPICEQLRLERWCRAQKTLPNHFPIEPPTWTWRGG
jgi:hypothetical protein